jgi:hypothetical protein
MSETQWKQFVQLFSEKNPHLTRQQVLQQAKKPFQQLLQYYQKGGNWNLIEFLIIDTTTGIHYTVKVYDKYNSWYALDQHDLDASQYNIEFNGIIIDHRTPLRTLGVTNNSYLYLYSK